SLDLTWGNGEGALSCTRWIVCTRREDRITYRSPVLTPVGTTPGGTRTHRVRGGEDRITCRSPAKQTVNGADACRKNSGRDSNASCTRGPNYLPITGEACCRDGLSPIRETAYCREGDG